MAGGKCSSISIFWIVSFVFWHIVLPGVTCQLGSGDSISGHWFLSRPSAVEFISYLTSGFRPICHHLSTPFDDLKNGNATCTVSTNQTVDDDKDDEPQIASFDEWTKKKLAEEQSKSTQDNKKLSANGHVQIPVVNGHMIPNSNSHHRNYASKECGAKILQSNPEAQNPGAVLKEKDRDEYMLNPCQTSSTKWFVVELCETVQVTRVDLANFELFSSSPKGFRVFSGSQRIPSATEEWNQLGEWTALDVKDIQSFEVVEKVYSKFLKFELLSHYGTEHFCPLSLIRIYGLSLVEEYEQALETQDNHGGTPLPASSHDAMPQAPAADSSLRGDQAPVAQVEDTLPSALPENNASSIQNLSAVPKVSLVLDTVKDMASKIYSQVRARVTPFFDFSVLNSHTCALNKPLAELRHMCLTNTAERLRCSTCRYFYLLVHKPLPQPLTQSQSESNVEHVTVSPANQTRRIDVCYPSDPIMQPYLLTKPKKNAIPSPATIPSPNFVLVTPITLNETRKESQTPNATLSNNVTGTQPARHLAQQESVFIRLTNRIKALELNISLSSQYLNELSRRYKKQMDDLQRAHNRTQTAYNQSVTKLEAQVAANVNELKITREEIIALKELVHVLKEHQTYRQDEFWQWQLCIVSLEVVIVSAFFWLCFVGRAKAQPAPLVAVQYASATPNHYLPPQTYCNGHVPKSFEQRFEDDDPDKQYEELKQQQQANQNRPALPVATAKPNEPVMSQDALLPQRKSFSFSCDHPPPPEVLLAMRRQSDVTAASVQEVCWQKTKSRKAKKRRVEPKAAVQMRPSPSDPQLGASGGAAPVSWGKFGALATWKQPQHG